MDSSPAAPAMPTDALAVGPAMLTVVLGAIPVTAAEVAMPMGAGMEPVEAVTLTDVRTVVDAMPTAVPSMANAMLTDVLK